MNKASIQIIICDDGEIKLDIVGDKGSDAIEIANDIMAAASDNPIGGYTFEEGQEMQLH